ncbi:MAG: beta-galactosidase [Clostridia bacterium]|nr:beta-galactosidase [Clostridia bacterium]
MNISFDTKSIIINGERKYLVSGEFHYFRVPRSDWERRMKLFIEAGGNCIATYVPWLVHEPEEGNILFDDCDERAITEYLALAEKLGLMVILRPGPYQYSELRCDGLPSWMHKNHPETLARRIDGSVVDEITVSYLHPEFLRLAEIYYKAFVEVVRPFLDKNVAMIQLDNELGGVHLWRGSLDYNAESMGFGDENGRYSRYLKNKYGNIEGLNKAYGTELSSFADVIPSRLSLVGLCDARFRRDYYLFYWAGVAEYGSILKKMLRKYGVNNMVCHNAAGKSMIADFEQFVESLGDDCLLGYDNYYNLDYGWAQNNPTPQYYASTLFANDVIRDLGQPPVVMEMPGGSPSDLPPILENDLYACYMSNMAAGMKGVNYYIYTGGPNPDGTGSTVDIYDYNAFVSADGTVKDTYNALKKFSTFATADKEFLTSDRCASVSVGFEWDMLRSDEFAGNPEISRTKGFMHDLYRNISYSLIASKFSGEFVNLAKKLDTSRPLIIKGCECMSETAQKNVIEFVENGGGLLVVGVLPHLDFDFNECTCLRDFIGENVTPCSPLSVVTKVDGNNIYRMNICVSADISDSARAFAFTEDNVVCGFEKNIGKGKVVFFGANWLTSTEAQIRMLEGLLEKIYASPVAFSSNRAISVSVFTNGNNVSAFVLNLFTGKMDTEVTVYDPKDPAKIIFKEKMTLDPMHVEYIKTK